MEPNEKQVLNQEIRERFGVLPEFFQTASEAPELIQELWNFAKGAYLDLPIPSVFKERLFVYLSRFCEVRYCAVRHCGFLIGRGRPAGDADAPLTTVEEAIELLKRPYPKVDEFKIYLEALESQTTPISWPGPNSEMESSIFACSSEIFLNPEASYKFRNALRHALGERNFELLMGYLAFIRTAHFWTLTHPDLEYEPDINALLEHHEDLAKRLLEDPEAGRCEITHRFDFELSELRQEKMAHEKLLEVQKKEIELSREVEKTKDFLETIIEQIPIGVCITEAPSGKALFNNKEIEKIAGVQVHNRQNIEGLKKYGGVRADGSKMAPEEYPSMRSIKEGITIKDEEMELIHPEKGKRNLMVSSSPIKDENNQTNAVVTSVVDITEIKDTEKKLKEALASRDEFLSIASHELKTPLTALSLQTEMMLLDIDERCDIGAIKDYLKHVDTHVNRMAQLVDDMMDISKIRSGNLSLSKKKTCISTLIDNVVKRLGPKFLGTVQGELKVELKEDVVANVDEARVEQVLTNLLTNAKKYGNGNDIEVTAGKSKDSFYIKVKDYGIGIEEEKLPLIFDRFERAISKNEVSGLGLGLYIVKQIVEAHGGSMTVKSKVGKGSEFCVLIPLGGEVE